MKGKEIKLGVAIALGGIVTSQGCGPHSHPDSNIQYLKSNDSMKLEKRLQELSKTRYSGKLSMGAMCYEVVAPQHVDYTCPGCGNVIKGKYDDWQIHQINEIEEIVNRIKEKGYDVILDKSGFCEHCAGEVPENPELIFKMRFSDRTGYHVVKSNIINEYRCVYEFISGNSTYIDDYDFEYALNDNVHIIRKMTGLGKPQ